MGTIAEIVFQLKRAGNRPMTGEELYRAVGHEDKQTIYSTLSYWTRKSTMLLRDKEDDEKEYRYRLNPEFAVPTTIKDDLVVIEQREAERKAEREAGLSGATAPQQSPPDTVTITVPQLKDAKLPAEQKPWPGTAAREEGSGDRARRVNGAHPYVAALAELEAHKAKLVEEMRLVDNGIEAMKLLGGQRA